jgi:hypothetical protein
MQYQAASTELRSPPSQVPFLGMIGEAIALALIASFLAWLV